MKTSLISFLNHSASGPLDGGERRVLLTVYRALLRKALAFDHYPALKVLYCPSKLAKAVLVENNIFHARQLFYCPHRTSFIGLLRTEFQQKKRRKPISGLDLAIYLLKELNQYFSTITEHFKVEPFKQQVLSVIAHPTKTISLTNLAQHSRSTPSTSKNVSFHSDLLSKTPEYEMRPSRWAHPEEYLRKGIYLVAHPLLWEKTFRKTVILIVEHNEKGTIGLILNKPMSRWETNHSLRKNVRYIPQGLDMPKGRLYEGGPVRHAENASEIGLVHSLFEVNQAYKEELENAQKDNLINFGRLVLENIYWAGESSFVSKVASARITTAKYYFGFASWFPGQLEKEIENGSWFLASGSSDLVFYRSTLDTSPKLVEVNDHQEKSSSSSSNAIDPESNGTSTTSTMEGQEKVSTNDRTRGSPNLQENENTGNGTVNLSNSGSANKNDECWREILRRLGGEYACFAEIPNDSERQKS